MVIKKIVFFKITVYMKDFSSTIETVDKSMGDVKQKDGS
jgi:hypothetical protein